MISEQIHRNEDQAEPEACPKCGEPFCDCMAVCSECGQVVTTSDIHPGTDICEDCCWEINQACEASMGFDSF